MSSVDHFAVTSKALRGRDGRACVSSGSDGIRDQLQFAVRRIGAATSGPSRKPALDDIDHATVDDDGCIDQLHFRSRERRNGFGRT